MQPNVFAQEIGFDLADATLSVSTIRSKRGEDWEIGRLFNAERTMCLVAFVNTVDTSQGERVFAADVSDAEISYGLFERHLEPAALAADAKLRAGADLVTSRSGTQYAVHRDDATDTEFRAFHSTTRPGNTSLFFTLGESWGALAGLAGRLTAVDGRMGARRVYARVQEGFVRLSAKFVETSKLVATDKEGKAIPGATRYAPLNYKRVEQARGILSNALALERFDRLLAVRASMGDGAPVIGEPDAEKAGIEFEPITEAEPF